MDRHTNVGRTELVYGDVRESSTHLYILKSEEYFPCLIRILKETVQTNGVIYVTTNKPYGLLTKALERSQIPADHIFFIDCISRHIGEGSGREPTNCIFVDGPQDLLAISIAASESVKHLSGDKALFVDSLSILLMYNDAGTVGKFSNFIINKMRYAGAKTIILALESDVDKDIIKQIASIVDEVNYRGS